MALSNSNPDIVGRWDVPLSDGVHIVEFEHGTTTGKRVIYVDKKVNIVLHKIKVFVKTVTLVTRKRHL